MIGKCLCGAVEFAISGELPNFYQCHCSLCRRLSGSASDTATFLNAEQFQWINGEGDVNSFKLPSGYRSDFCMKCGSTVPHLMDNGLQYWIPAGLLDDSPSRVVAAHLFVGSKASWDEIGDSGEQYTEMPSMSVLDSKLQNRS